MSAIQTWATVALLIVGAVALARIAVATKGEWKNLFKGEENDRDR